MATSLQSKIDDLEARFKAESSEDSSRLRSSESSINNNSFTNNINLASPLRKIQTGQFINILHRIFVLKAITF